MRLRSPLAVLVLSLAAASAVAQEAHQAAHRPGAPAPALRLYDDLGSHSFRITVRRPVAQQWFDQGLRLAYAFNHEEAARAFAEGLRRDPSCAMCAWGIAYALGPNINAPMDADTERRAFDAAQRAVRGAARVTPLERALIGAMAARYGTPAGRDRARRDSAWAEAMAAVARDFPAADEALTLHAEALMNLSPWMYWERDGSPRPATPGILASLERVLERNPNHPGACHFYIHAVEARDPARAVPCAERLAALMPGAGHIVHMPGHIYIRVGRWADAIEANRHAVHADHRYFEGPHTSRVSLYGQGYAPHNWHFMSFAATMAGHEATAIEAAREVVAALDPGMARTVPMIEALVPVHLYALLTFGRWDEVLTLPLPDSGMVFASGMAHYARGVAQAATGRQAEAAVSLTRLRAAAARVPGGELHTVAAIAVEALAGEIALRGGDTETAIARFRAAAELEDGLPYMEPPHWYYPMRHSLGKALLQAGRAREAETAFREDLARFPENAWSLTGLRQSLEQLQRTAEAAEVARRLEAATRGGAQPSSPRN